MPSPLPFFIFFPVVLTSINVHMLLLVSFSDFNSMFCDSYRISITLFLIPNVCLAPVSVSIHSTVSEKFSRDSTLEIRPLPPAG